VPQKTQPDYTSATDEDNLESAVEPEQSQPGSPVIIKRQQYAPVLAPTTNAGTKTKSAPSSKKPSDKDKTVDAFAEISVS
jgi:hypothetical protein